MRRTLLVHTGESKTDADLLLARLKKHSKDPFITVKNFRAYCLIERIPHKVNHDSLMNDIEELGFRVLLAIEENSDGIDEVYYPENDAGILEGYKTLNKVLSGLLPRE